MLKSKWFLGLLFLASWASAQDLDVTQIDSSRLLTRQEVDLYLSVTDNLGQTRDGVSSDQFLVWESSDLGTTFTSVPLLGFSGQAPLDDGITFFLLVDNSGSMYEEEESRIRQVREAIKTFMGSVDSPKDSFGLSEFNTLYKTHTKPIHELNLIRELLDQIQRPERVNGYTELYEGILQGLEGVDAYPGRKVMILLSDGEHFSFQKGEKKPHPVFGEKESQVDDVIEALGRSGITLFAIRFGDEKDRSLEVLTRSAGGRIYDASNQEELAGVYLDIRSRVLKEYKLTYRATMHPAEKRVVKVVYDAHPGSAEAQRTYFAGTLFGLPGSPYPWLLLVVLFVALLLWLALTQLKFLNRSKDATLEVLSGGSGRTLALTENRTVIGSSSSDHLTITGAPQLKESHATIVFDPAKSVYTVVSEAPIKVNNRKVEKGRRLESGDVIQVGGATIVFDETKFSKESKN